MIKTRLTDLLDLQYPIVSAPMGRYTGSELATAVSNAGGLGTFGATHPSRPIEAAYVKDQIRQVRSQTARPFGVGFITHLIERNREVFDTVIELNAPVVLLSFADPRPWLSRIKASGAIAICQVQTFEHARIAVEEGVDVLAVQGNESGGHCGELNLLPFLAKALDEFPDTPILAAGGMASSRSLAAVLAAGADGAWIGTAFAAVTEATGVTPMMRNRILASDGRDTVRTRVFDMLTVQANLAPAWPVGIAFRAGRNRLLDTWHGNEETLRGQIDQVAHEFSEARRTGDPDIAPAVYGESAGFVEKSQTAAEFMRELCAAAALHLTNGSGRVTTD